MWNKLIFFLAITVNIYANESIVSSLNSSFRLDEKYKSNRNSIKLVTEKYRNHLLEIEIPEWVSTKHHESISTVILSEMISSIHKFGNYQNNTGIIECTANQPNKYSLANFNYLVLINSLNFMINCDKNKNAKTIDEVVNKICDIEKYKQFSNKLRTASSNIKTYMDGLKLYDFLQEITKVDYSRIDKLSYQSFSEQYIKSRLPNGIVNERMTCYFNSVFQLLYSIKKLRNFIIQKANNCKNINNNKMLNSLNSAFVKIGSNIGKTQPVSLEEEKKNVWECIRCNTNYKNSEFKFSVMNDSADFFRWIISYLKDELLLMDGISMPDIQNTQEKKQQAKEYYDNYDKYLKFFYCKEKKIINCNQCDYNTTLVNKNYYEVFPIEITTISGDFLNDLKDILQIDDYKHDVNNGSSVNHSITWSRLFKTNDLIPICLKRTISIDGRNMNNSKKIYTPSNFVEMLKYNGKQYKLRAAIFHSGSVSSGHYICRAYADDGTVYEANDESVKSITNEISNSLTYSSDKKQLTGYTDTVLLYERVLWD